MQGSLKVGGGGGKILANIDIILGKVLRPLQMTGRYRQGYSKWVWGVSGKERSQQHGIGAEHAAHRRSMTCNETDNRVFFSPTTEQNAAGCDVTVGVMVRQHA